MSPPHVPPETPASLLRNIEQGLTGYLDIYPGPTIPIPRATLHRWLGQCALVRTLSPRTCPLWLALGGILGAYGLGVLTWRLWH